MIKYKIIVLMCVIWPSAAIYNNLTTRPDYTEYFCKDNFNIVASYNRIRALKHGYTITINKDLDAETAVTVRFDSQCTVQFDANQARKKQDIDDNEEIRNIFSFALIKKLDNFKFHVKGREPPFHPPYVLSLQINGKENCEEPNRTFFTKRNTGVTKFWNKSPDIFCGRRKIYKQRVELIVGSSPARRGFWPWHVALLRVKDGGVEFICGGTLLTKLVVLTAAHCVADNGYPVSPETRSVILGKHILEGKQVTNQRKDVAAVIMHENFRPVSLNNDIALLKLSTEAEFNNYVQPACLWVDDIYDQLNSFEIIGMVVGWGIDQDTKLSPYLREARMPIAKNPTCISYEPVLYSNALHENMKFCAGNGNGTSTCNGDSGGGFYVFVKDKKDFSNDEDTPGAWYVKGVVSNAISIEKNGKNVCDPSAYPLFTNVEQYRDWILNNI